MKHVPESRSPREKRLQLPETEVVRRVVLQNRTRVEPRRAVKSHVFAVLLLDALRGARKYVLGYRAGRGAE